MTFLLSKLSFLLVRGQSSIRGGGTDLRGKVTEFQTFYGEGHRIAIPPEGEVIKSCLER